MSEAVLGPKSAKYRVFCGYTWKTPGIPGKYPATAWVSCRFPQFCLRFCPRPALRLRETREFPEWSTKHPLFSLEISGNAKCWGPSVFLFVCRKTWYIPRPEERRALRCTASCSTRQALRDGPLCAARYWPHSRTSGLAMRPRGGGATTSIVRCRVMRRAGCARRRIAAWARSGTIAVLDVG